MPKYGQFIYGEQLYGERVLPDPDRTRTSYRIPLGSDIRRSIGKRITFQISHGGQQRKPYHVPDNPQTVPQQAWRAVFTTAVAATLALTDQQKAPYIQKAKRYPGQTWFTLFMKEYLWSQSH